MMLHSVFITGTTRGIGLELTRQFLDTGSKVFAGARNTESDALQSLKADHVGGTVQRAVAPTLVWQHVVFMKALPGVIALRLDDNKGSHSKMVVNGFSITM